MPHLAHMVSVLTGLFIPMSVPVHLFCFPFLQGHQSWGFIPDSTIVVSENIASHFAFLPSLAILDSWPDCATGLLMQAHAWNVSLCISSCNNPVCLFDIMHNIVMYLVCASILNLLQWVGVVCPIFTSLYTCWDTKWFLCFSCSSWFISSSKHTLQMFL